MDVQGLMAGLMAWVVFQTGLSAPNSLPRIVFVPREAMIEFGFGASAPRGLRLRALYSKADETIYLRDDWNPYGLRSQSDLLHELVHHVQKFNNVEVPCNAALEADAYRLQFRWLREQGVENPYAMTETNELWVTLASRCHDDGE